MPIRCVTRRQRLSRIAVAASAVIACHATAFAQAPDGVWSSVSERSSPGVARVYIAATASLNDARAVPANITAASQHLSLIETMIARSAAFRRQCVRIANEPYLTVVVRRAFGRLPGGVRARTHIVRQPGGGMLATVDLGWSDDDVELIAHELEHVIEQLDQIDLASKAGRSESGVRAYPAGSVVFETRRAARIGLRVAEEVREPSRLGD
jgi:hypothetical protein